MKLPKERSLYSLQLCVDIAMDVVAMLTKDLGITVEDDYTNIQRLLENGILLEKEAGLLRQFNAVRNAIVHKYDRLNLEIINEAFSRVDELYNIVTKLIESYESLVSLQ